jgi:hypothetical protein
MISDFDDRDSAIADKRAPRELHIAQIVEKRRAQFRAAAKKIGMARSRRLSGTADPKARP